MPGFAKKYSVRIIVAVIVILAAVCVIYVSDYYRADDEAIMAFSTMSKVQVQYGSDMVVFGDEKSDIGFIFYPGGKVEYTAYEPLMAACSEKGVLCVLLKMPLNLAVLDINAAEDITGQFPQISHWYIGGHSLGGSMAAAYGEEYYDKLCGVVLLGAYSTADLSETGLAVLSVYGSEDGVMNREKYDKYRSMLPEDMREIVIEGGCHSGFGMYGTQAGDGEPSITADEQINITAEEIYQFLINCQSGVQ